MDIADQVPHLVQAADLSVEEHARLTRSWQQAAPLPTAQPERLVLALISSRGLREVRHQVRDFLEASIGAATPDVAEEAVERAVMVIDELTSNAVRHGLPPSSLCIGDEPTQWAIAVIDSAPAGYLSPPGTDPPVPAGMGSTSSPT